MQAVYSFLDEWGWNLAFSDPGMGALLESDEVDARIAERIKVTFCSMQCDHFAYAWEMSAQAARIPSHQLCCSLSMWEDVNASTTPMLSIDRIVRQGELRFLDGQSYRGLFCLSKAHRQTLQREDRVLSREKGTFSFMHSQGLCVARGSGNGKA